MQSAKPSEAQFRRFRRCAGAGLWHLPDARDDAEDAFYDKFIGAIRSCGAFPPREPEPLPKCRNCGASVPGEACDYCGAIP